ncbi:MAG: 30S ribosome-binding factor RbfA [Alphaproteobacteria bacterium]|nr:30S ribosome-binding factor RbfA [Alphaproteobacteria bacterium]
MKSQRQLQIGENIKRIMSEIFLRDDYSVIKNNVITILEADVSPDAKNVKIFIDIFGDSTKHEQIFDKIVDNIPHFRYELAKKIDLRFTPEILFVHDKTYQKANLIESILNQGHKNSDHIIEHSNKLKRKIPKNRHSKTSKTNKK